MSCTDTVVRWWYVPWCVCEWINCRCETRVQNRRGAVYVGRRAVRRRTESINAERVWCLRAATSREYNIIRTYSNDGTLFYGTIVYARERRLVIGGGIIVYYLFRHARRRAFGGGGGRACCARVCEGVRAWSYVCCKAGWWTSGCGCSCM